MFSDFIPALQFHLSNVNEKKAAQTERDSVYGDKERMICEGRRRRITVSLHVTTWFCKYLSRK